MTSERNSTMKNKFDLKVQEFSKSGSTVHSQQKIQELIEEVKQAKIRLKLKTPNLLFVVKILFHLTRSLILNFS